MRELKLAHNWIVNLLVFLVPLFFLPFTSDAFEFNKLMLLSFGTVFAVFLWALAYARGTFKLRVTPFDLPVLSFAVIALLSSFLMTPNKLDAFLFPGTATTIVASTLFYFVVTQYLRSETDDNATTYKSSPLFTFFLAGIALSALVSALAGLKVFGLFGDLFPEWLKQPTFNTIGGLLPAAILYIVALPILLERVIKRVGGDRILNIAFLLLVVVGLAATVFHILPGQPFSPRLLPMSSGWSIVLETLKGNLLLGVGPGNFAEAFNRFRPVDFNATDVWNLKFVASSNWYLHVWTTMGVLGILSFLWIILTMVRQGRVGSLRGFHYSLLAILLIFLVVPVGLTAIFVFYLLLAHFASPRGRDVSLSFAATPEGERGRTNLLPGMVAIISLLGLLVGGYYAKNVYAAEISFREALEAAARNDAKATYDALVVTTQKNPYIDRYRVTFSQTNLLIANSMASNENLSDADRQTVAQLIQQSIREGQAAVATNRNRAENWENLARVYQSIVGLAQGADQYSASTYAQAVALDPVNPLTRVAFGGLLYSLKQYEEAVKVFELAVASKPDFANAHYNLAVALREKGDIVRAAQEMAAALSLTDESTPGFQEAKTQLEALQKQVKDLEASQAAQIQQQQSNTPQTALQAPPSPQPTPENPLVLPPDAAPPATQEASPIPAPTVSPSALPTASPTPSN